MGIITKIIADFVMRENEHYWIGARGNVWTKTKYSKEEALEAEQTLKNCRNCTDCINCENCVDCRDCAYCTDCADCTDCMRCSMCCGCVDINHAHGERGAIIVDKGKRGFLIIDAEDEASKKFVKEHPATYVDKENKSHCYMFSSRDKWDAALTAMKKAGVTPSGYFCAN